MPYHALADLVVLLHLAFVIFALLGGLLVLRWRRVAWAHIPAVLWAGTIEFAGWICPLTPMENWLRGRGGEMGYGADFVEYYIIPVLYPAELTTGVQILLGLVVLGINGAVYGWLLLRGNRPGAQTRGGRR